MTDRWTAIRNRIARAARRLPPPFNEMATALLRFFRKLSQGRLPVSLGRQESKAQGAVEELWSEKTSMELEELISQISALTTRLEKTEKLTIEVARSLEYSMIEIRELQRDNPSTRPEDQL